MHHGGGTVPAVGQRPVVLTLHDLQFLRYPEYVHPVKLRYLRREVRASVHRATVVAVPSEYVRSTVIDEYGVDGSRVVVVPHGIDVERPSTEAIAAVRDRYGLGDSPYLVLPAITHPHKGHRFVLDTLAAGPADRRVVFLGGRGAADDEVAAAIAALALGERVLRPGRVPAGDRDAIVAGAQALLFPSQYEGFGAPVLEAMALGTPVICSDQASLPEVAGDAAFVTPLDRDAWLAALDALPTRARRTGRCRPGTGPVVQHPALGRSAAHRVRSCAPMTSEGALTLLVLCPHFEPDTAPTGAVMTRIVQELVSRGHRVHVVTSLPWYREHRVEASWAGARTQVEETSWGSITRVHPFASPDKRNLLRRALGFGGFSALVGWRGLAGRPPEAGRRRARDVAAAHPRAHGLGVAPVASGAARVQRAGHLPRRRRGIRRAERPIGVRSRRRRARGVGGADDLPPVGGGHRAQRGPRRQRPGQAAGGSAGEGPGDPELRRRRRDRAGPEAQRLSRRARHRTRAGRALRRQRRLLPVARPRRWPRPASCPDVTFVIHGDGSAKAQLAADAADVANLRFSPYLPMERLAEVLAAGDVHVVPLKAGLGSVSVPSKTYSILAAGRPAVAAIDADTEVPRILAESGAGIAVPPDQAGPFVAALRALVDDP